MKCVNCGAEVTGRFCSYCGSEIPQKETNINIKQNGNIVNNYNYGNVTAKSYEEIYEEEKMREVAREKIIKAKQLEEKRKKEEHERFIEKQLEVQRAEQERKSSNSMIIWIVVFGILFWRISSWWNGLFDDGIKPMKIGSEQYNSVITIEDNVIFCDGLNENYEGKWYRITFPVNRNYEDSIYSNDYGINNKYYYCEMEENIKLEEIKKDTFITVIGHLDRSESRRVYFSHCIIE